MKTSIVIIISLVTTCIAYSANSRKKSAKEDDTLVMVHVLFRHGQRTPDVSTIYPNDPYRNETYAPYGLGALTNKGKNTEFNIGTALRERYGKFFGSYLPSKIQTLASPFSRTKISAQLVLASLFPPVGLEKWNDELNWQPIDFEYNPRDTDLLFLHGLNCKTYIDLSNEILKMAVDAGEFGNYVDIATYLEYHSGWPVPESPELAFNIYSALLTEKEWGFELPEWTKQVYPEPLSSIAVEYLAQLVKTDTLKQLSGGFLLRHMMDETISKIKDDPKLRDRKISLYSGHDFTIVALLGALGIFEPHLPPYGAYVLLEVHNIRNTYGIKVFYQDYTGMSPELIQLPDCDEICPLEKFIALYSKLFPEPDMCTIKG